jgi:hypothetical protein
VTPKAIADGMATSIDVNPPQKSPLWMVGSIFIFAPTFYF